MFGNNMFIDDITVEEFAACSGTPSAGTLTGPAGACSGSQIILENTGATDADGMTYVWQSSSNAGGPWTDIPGQTSLNIATTSQTADTYYQFVATCSNSGQSAISNVILYSGGTYIMHVEYFRNDIDGFIQNKYRWIVVQGASNSNSLTLTTG